MKDNMSFAKDNWEEFEKLSISILETYLPVNSEISYSITHTPNRKDGGYDGLIIISSDNENIDQYKILSESKLRELSNKDLPMSDFSKTLIIAINLMAQKIYIFTNLHYSTETQKRIHKFSSFSNIQVELVDIFEVSDRVKELYKTLKDTYSPTFLKKIIDSVSSHPASKRVSFEKKVHITSLSKLIGSDRNNQLDQCYKAISGEKGIVIIKGCSGCGKSFFIEHLLNKMYREGSIPYHKINMEEFSTVQAFLLKILSAIWNIDTLDITNFSEQDINEIMDYLSEEELSIRSRTSLLNILKPESVSNETQQDILQFYFFEYLYRIYVPILRRKKQVIYFDNLDYASGSAFQILNKFIKKFEKENILLLLEIRTDIKKCEDFLAHLMRDVPVIYITEIKEFDSVELSQYFEYKYKNEFSYEEEKALKKILPRTPLLIDTVTELFRHDLGMRGSLYTLDMPRLYKNQKYLQSISLEYVKKIIVESEIEIQNLACIIGLMEGKLPESDLKIICNNYSVKEGLIRTKLFQFQNGNIQIRHMFYLGPLQQMAFLSSYRQHEIYTMLFDKIELLSVDKFCKTIKKIQLAIFLENRQYLGEKWKEVISNLLFQEDYVLAQSLLKDVYNLMENDFSVSELFDIFLMSSYCCLKLCDFHSDLLQTWFRELHNLSLIAEISPEQMKWYYLLQAKYYLAVGQYQALIRQTDELRTIEPQLRHIRAIGIKHQYGMSCCILSLKRGIKRFPENMLLKYSYYDHLLAISINRGNFKKAKANIDILKTYKEALSLEDQIHLEFNELTVLFYSKEMTDIRQLLDLCGKAYQNNLYVELSRSYNLLGQFFWAKKEWEKAIEAFNEAAGLQDRTEHQTYRWIAKTNLALINLELKNKSEAIMHAREIILGYYSSKQDKFKYIFAADNKTAYTDFFTDKEMVSILLMLRILYKNDQTEYTKIIEKVTQTDIGVLPKEFEYFISHSLVSELKKTYYYVDGNFMIKC